MIPRKSKSQNPLIYLNFLFFFSFGFCQWSIYQNQILWTMPLLEKYRNTRFSVPSQVLSSNPQRCENNQILKIRGIVLSSPVFLTILPQRILKSYFLPERTTYECKGYQIATGALNKANPVFGSGASSITTGICSFPSLS